ncbi:MAG: VOC family protein [Verrucomicrobia bacterium]|nr:VOC family protein [Leptolyngbya sp. ES-bin-22]
MKFTHTSLFVKDVPQAVAFCEQAFGMRKRFTHESEMFAEMELGDAVLHFAANEPVKANLSQGFQENSLSNLPPGIELCFETDDVAGAFVTAVAAGATAYAEPTIRPWGQTVAYVRDLDGVLIEIGQPSW